MVKIDIEGFEYDLLEHMIETRSVEYINKIYCEWHVDKLYKNNREQIFERHNNLIKKLNKMGFNLKGENNTDELYKIIRKR